MALAVLTIPLSANALTTIEVDSGEQLTPIDLSNGSFMGVGFTLDPATTFSINDGGRVGPVASNFDFNRATVDLNSGGRVFSGISMSDVLLNVLAGGVVDPRMTAKDGSTVNLFAGGNIGREFGITSGSTLNVFGGEIDGDIATPIKVNTGGAMNVSGGSVGQVQLRGGSVIVTEGTVSTILVSSPGPNLVTVQGGSVGRLSTSLPDTTFEIGGGVVGSVTATAGATATIEGGRIGGLNAESGSNVTLVGGEFLLNGSPYANPTVTLTKGDFFTGTLSDGSTFAFSAAGLLGNDNLVGVRLEPSTLPVIDTTPIQVNGSHGPAPNGLRSGQTMTLGLGGTIESPFSVVGATLLVDGGETGPGLEAYDSQVTISSGRVTSIDAGAGSVVDLQGGLLLGIHAEPNSTVNLFGREFFINGIAVPIGAPFQPYDLFSVRPPSQSYELSGILADGSPFRYFVTDSISSFNGIFLPGSSLTLTLVPEPNSLLLLANLGQALLLYSRRRGAGG